VFSEETLSRDSRAWDVRGGRGVTLHRSIIRVAAWLEVIVGAVVLTAPDVACLLLFGARRTGVEVPLARFAGIALVALGIVCLPSTAGASRWSVVLGLLTFNFGVAVLFAWLGVASMFRGLLLWPAFILHAVLAAALLPVLLSPEGQSGD
jgi:hypothetical protein